jgi:hypothetical protein
VEIRGVIFRSLPPSLSLSLSLAPRLATPLLP